MYTINVNGLWVENAWPTIKSINLHGDKRKEFSEAEVDRILEFICSQFKVTIYEIESVTYDRTLYFEEKIKKQRDLPNNR
jgi:hypothetical protein